MVFFRFIAAGARGAASVISGPQTADTTIPDELSPYRSPFWEGVRRLPLRDFG